MSTAQRRVLTSACMACNRVSGEPMCELCDDLESAEERASDHDDPKGSDNAHARSEY